MFKHLDYLKGEVDLEATSIDGTRFYRVPSGDLYPSITSVTSFYNREIFYEWRKRVGENTKIIFCGDAAQTDLVKTNERNGILDFKKIILSMADDFESIEFDINDIVRSGLVRNYLLTKIALGM